MNIYEQLDNVIEQQGDLVLNLNSGEERNDAISDYSRLVKLRIDKDTMDEDVLDRRTKMEDEKELNLKRLELDRLRVDNDQDVSMRRIELDEFKSKCEVELNRQRQAFESARSWRGISKDAALKIAGGAAIFIGGEIATNFGLIKARWQEGANAFK